MFEYCCILQVSIVSDNGLAPNRRQAIIWNNDDLVYLQFSVSLVNKTEGNIPMALFNIKTFFLGKVIPIIKIRR